MGKKMLLGLGAIALAALLTVNVGIVSNNDSTSATFTLDKLEAMALPGEEIPGEGGGGKSCLNGMCKEMRCSLHNMYVDCKVRTQGNSCDMETFCW
jgi:hypothetical protein